MKPIIQVRGVRKDKEKKIAGRATRPQDMPKCAGCQKQAMGAAVQGYDGKWRCLPCNAAHADAVLREAGDSAPNASEDRRGVAAKPVDESPRKARADKMLEKYGVTKRNTWH